MRKTTAVFFHTVVPGRASFVTFLTCKYAVPLKRKHHLLCVYLRTCCCCSIRRTPSAGTDFLIFVSSSTGSVGTSLASQSSHLKNASFFCLSASLFSSPFFFRRRACFFHLLLFLVASLLHVRPSMLLSSVYRKHSTAQRHIRPARDRKSNTCRSERNSPSKQTDLWRASI